MTHDTWHMGGGELFSSSLFISLALTVRELKSFKNIFTKDDSLNDPLTDLIRKVFLDQPSYTGYVKKMGSAFTAVVEFRKFYFQSSPGNGPDLPVAFTFLSSYHREQGDQIEFTEVQCCCYIVIQNN